MPWTFSGMTCCYGLQIKTIHVHVELKASQNVYLFVEKTLNYNQVGCLSATFSTLFSLTCFSIIFSSKYKNWKSLAHDAIFISLGSGGTVASWLLHSSLDQVVRVRALAGDTMLCSQARHLTLTVPLSTQVYKWVPANCWGNLTNCGEVTCDGLASHPGGVEILLAPSCYRN